MKKVLSLVLLVVFMSTLLFGCGQKQSANEGNKEAPAQGQETKEDTKAVVLKLSHVGGTDHAYQKGAEMFRDIVKEKTNGAVDIEIFPANQLGTQQEVTEGIQLGTVDLAIVADDALATLVPEMGALGMPFLFKDTDDVYNTLNGEVGDVLAKKLESKNVILMSWLENGFRNITNNKKPIVVPEDLTGIKIRTSSTKPNMMAFNTYGASATNIAFSELYNALQVGVVDAQENPFTNILDKKFYEVQKYMSVSGHVHTAEPMIMSKKAYGKLTPEQQTIFVEAGKEVSKWAFENAKENYTKELEELKGLMEVNEVDREAFIKASQPVYDEYYDKYKEILDMIRK
ncbi:TRAP transporter substrate-binding protein [Petroclostridium sp. X23]|uniref:TRAP transporter substrate-binding protein n=1 Tax=Petroclostridium sp. X23 TaxID=3045146 RepID=UPI0024AE674E|nr:TRAP transporter substrate-binding protein [Petroclostridium sp. X23]WHH57832.1 TRAP transporter substrate-binding protein [Petroclostridium sp. X23]